MTLLYYFLKHIFRIKKHISLRRYQYEISSSYIYGRHNVHQLYVSCSTQEKKSRIKHIKHVRQSLSKNCTLLNTYTHRWGKKKRSSSQRYDIIHHNEIKRPKHKWWFFQSHRCVSWSALFLHRFPIDHHVHALR